MTWLKQNSGTVLIIVAQLLAQLVIVGIFAGMVAARLDNVEKRLETLDNRQWNYMRGGISDGGKPPEIQKNSFDNVPGGDRLNAGYSAGIKGPIFKESNPMPESPDLTLYFWWKCATRQHGPLISRAEAGRLLGVTPQTIANMVNRGHLTTVPKPNATLETGMIPLRDICVLLEEAQNSPQPYQLSNTSNVNRLAENLTENV